MFNWVVNLFKRKKFYERPVPSGIIKLTDVAKDFGLPDDELKKIYLNDGSPSVKYTKEQAEVLRESGIPVLPEEDSEDFTFLPFETEGGYEIKR